MSKNEVVDTLKEILTISPKIWSDKSEQALTEAIRAVELLPELVEEVEYYMEMVDEGMALDAITLTNMENTREILKKAKGLSEC
jgi:hypothetical protein